MQAEPEKVMKKIIESKFEIYVQESPYIAQTFRYRIALSVRYVVTCLIELNVVKYGTNKFKTSKVFPTIQITIEVRIQIS